MSGISDLKFMLVCEHLRQEPGNKITLMGLVLGDLIVPDAPHQALSSLGILLSFDKAKTSGTWPLKFEINGPDGNLVASTSGLEGSGRMEVVTEAGHPTIVAMEFGPLILKGYGEYVAVATIGNDPVSASFNVVRES